MQNDLPGWGMQRYIFIFFLYETHGFGFGGSERKKQLGTTGREAQKLAERAGGHEGLAQRESSVLTAALERSLPMVCSWIRNQKGLGLVYSWGLLRTLEGFEFV